MNKFNKHCGMELYVAATKSKRAKGSGDINMVN